MSLTPEPWIRIAKVREKDELAGRLTAADHTYLVEDKIAEVVDVLNLVKQGDSLVVEIGDVLDAAADVDDVKIMDKVIAVDPSLALLITAYPSWKRATAIGAIPSVKWASPIRMAMLAAK
jgi:predicted P-loop ATPase/GTPase